MLHELFCSVKSSASVGRKVDQRVPSGVLIAKALRLCNAAKPLWKVLASNLAPYGGKAFFGDGLFLLVKMAELVFEVAVDVCVIEPWLQLLNVGGFDCLKLWCGDAVLYREWNILAVIVVFFPPSQCELCVNDGFVAELLEFAVAVGLACGEGAVAAAHIAEGFVHL